MQGGLLPGDSWPLTEDARRPGEPYLDGTSQGVTVWDLFYVGLTIVVFAVLLLILKGIESFER